MTAETWKIANQQYLTALLEAVKSRLVRRLDEMGISVDILTQPQEVIQQQLQAAEATLPAPAALQHLCSLCKLSTFERDVLLLCAAMELDATFAPLFGMLQGDAQRNYPTFSLALGNLPNPNWGALSPSAPLRYWQLIDIGSGRALTTSPLRIDERVLNYLVGVYHLDERLMGLVKPIQSDNTLVLSHQTLADQLTYTWAQAKELGQQIPVLQLCGGESIDRQAISYAAAAQLGLNLHALSASALPTTAIDLNRFARRWHREAIFSQSALLLEWDETNNAEQSLMSTIGQFIDDLNSPVILSCQTRQHLPKQTMVSFDVELPTDTEQQHLWKAALGDETDNLNGQVQQLVTQFNLNATLIQSAYVGALGQLSQLESQSNNAELNLSNVLWHACRNQARPRMEAHAQRLNTSAAWTDLILPQAQKDVLQEIAAHLRQRAKVYQAWGFADKSKRGLGITALFAGASGTGKTLAAEVLAAELKLDLYKIDLSTIISKYIGETEKNLGKVFDAAEMGGAILLFDEADALFGKRNEVKDSHDRYANIEVSYLLQRMEAYRGLAILTTNLPDSIDRAFLRRIRFIVQFPFPDMAQRVEIWQRMFPLQTPTEALNFKKLSRLNVAGGNIRNIALNAAFLAADADEPVQMKHLLQATRSEYIKLERPLTDVEVGGWVA